MTDEQLVRRAQRIARRWQKRLRMRDWEVSFRVADVPHGKGSGVWASVASNTDHMQVEVQLWSRVPEGQLEQTIVHELLHVLLTHCDRAVIDACGSEPDHYTRAQETALNCIAEALVAARSGGAA